MIFKLYDCDFGVTLNGVNYDFEHVENLQIEDPERTRLIRGGNAGNKTGLIYKEGTKEPKAITLTVIGMPAELHVWMHHRMHSRIKAVQLSFIASLGRKTCWYVSAAVV